MYLGSKASRIRYYWEKLHLFSPLPLYAAEKKDARRWNTLLCVSWLRLLECDTLKLYSILCIVVHSINLQIVNVEAVYYYHYYQQHF